MKIGMLMTQRENEDGGKGVSRKAKNSWVRDEGADTHDICNNIEGARYDGHLDHEIDLHWPLGLRGFQCWG